MKTILAIDLGKPPYILLNRNLYLFLKIYTTTTILISVTA